PGSHPLHQALPPLQGEGRGGDGVKSAPEDPIPLLSSPLKGEGRLGESSKHDFCYWRDRHYLKYSAWMDDSKSGVRNSDTRVRIKQMVKSQAARSPCQAKKRLRCR